MEQFEDLDNLFQDFGINADGASYTPVEEFPIEEQGWGEEAIEGREEYLIATRVESFCEAAQSDVDSDTETQGPTENAVDLPTQCTCKTACIFQFDKQTIEEHRLSIQEMIKSEKEMFIIGCLNPISDATTRLGKRQRSRFRFCFNGKQVCKKTFMFINDVGIKALRHILEHINENGFVPRVHGNAGRKPHHALQFNDVKRSVDWLLWYADIYGLPMPAAPRGEDGTAPVLLPSNLSKVHLHREYLRFCEHSSVRSIGISSFKGIWKACVPHIRIMSPREDVCPKCELLRKKVADAGTDAEKLASATALSNHVQDAQSEKMLYRECIIEAQEELIKQPIVRNQIVLPLSSNLNKVHYTFDYSQSVILPHHSQQMGPMYFVSGRKVNIFGVRVDSSSQQYNYLIDEHQSIGPDGKGTHGPNSVISMLHHSINHNGFGERSCILHADNCGGQNKNRFMLAYLSWRINCGLHENITLLMAIPGHTKCLVDGGFGHIKKLFRRSDCDSVEQLTTLVDKSAISNYAVPFLDSDGQQTWQWYDWKTFLMEYFTPVKGIQKFHHFRFTTHDKMAVYVRERNGGDEERVQIMKRNAVIPVGAMPSVINPAGLTRQRQQYLFSNVRGYVRPPYQDVTCPRVSEE